MNFRLICYISARNDNHVTLFPRTSECRIYFKCSISEIRSLGQGSPSRFYRSSMHLECTRSDSDTFVTVDWHLWIVFFTVQSNLKLGAVWVFFCTNFHCTAIDEDVLGIELSKSIRIIRIAREDYHSTFFNDH